MNEGLGRDRTSTAKARSHNGITFDYYYVNNGLGVVLIKWCPLTPFTSS